MFFNKLKRAYIESRMGIKLGCQISLMECKKRHERTFNWTIRKEIYDNWNKIGETEAENKLKYYLDCA